MKGCIPSARTVLRVALALVVLAVYAPHLRGDFVWDDQEYLHDEPRMAQPGGARALATQSFGHGGGVYRPVSTLSLWAEVRAHGMSMPALRAGNIGVHAAVADALFALLVALGLALEGAALVAALFALHPAATEAVMFANARHDALGTLFALLALRVAVHPVASRRGFAGAVTAVAVCALLAVGCKEVFAVLPALVALAALLSSVTPAPWAARARRAGAYCVAAGSSVGVYLAWRRYLGIHTDNALTGVPAGTAARWVVSVVARTFALLFGARQGATAEAWRPLSGAAAAGFGAAGAMLVAVLVAVRRRAPDGVDRVLYGLVWITALAAPTALAIPVTGQYANRYLYAPLVGWALVVGALALVVQRATPRARRLALGAGALVAVVFGVVSTLQAARWRTARALFGADLAEHPDDARVVYHYAVEETRAGGCAVGVGLFARAAELEPGYARAWHNTAGCLLRLGRPDDAREPARRALRLAPGSPANQINYGAALVLSGERARGEPWLARGCAARPVDPACALIGR